MSSIFEEVVLVLIVNVGVSLLIIGLLYWRDRKIFGQTAALKNLLYLTPFVLTVCCYYSFSYIFFSRLIWPDTAAIMALTTLLMPIPLIKVLIWYWHRQAGALLLNLRKHSSPTFDTVLVVTSFLAVAAINSIPIFLVLFQKGEIEFLWLLDKVISSLYWSLLAFCYLLNKSGHIEIREQGICGIYFCLGWKAIEFYSIDKEDNILFLKHQTIWPIFRYLQLQINSEKKEEIGQLLNRYILEKSHLN